MAATYCTADQVISRLQLIDPSTAARFADSTTTLPSTAELEELINFAEDEIDRYCLHAWRTVTVTNEYQTPTGPRFLYHRYCFEIKLEYQDLTTFTSGTDKIEYFNGTTWVDLVATGTAGDGFGEGDFWVDLKNGIIYVNSGSIVWGASTFRVTYRYGASSVPKDIKHACIMMVCEMLVSTDFYTRYIPSHTDRMALETLIEGFSKRAYRILDRHRRVYWI